MFFVKIKNPVHLGLLQTQYNHIHKEYGIDAGVHLVKNGHIQGRRGSVRYWDYQELFERIPSYKGRSNLETEQDEDGKEFIVMDLFWQDGLLLEPGVRVELVEGNIIPERDGGGVLLLCKMNERYFQVTVDKIIPIKVK